MKRFAGVAMAAAILATPVAAQAQFGGLGGLAHHALGGGGDSGAAPAGPSADAFLSATMLSTKNVMISAALLAQALEDRTKLAGVKAYAEQVGNCSDPKALDAMRGTLESNIAALNARKDLAGDLKGIYEAGDSHQKQLIGVALVNLAIGIYRDTQLAPQAPGAISSLGANPMMLSKVGQLKVAGSLLVLQTKGLATVGTALPRVMSAVKIASPALAETSKPTPVTF